MKFTILLSGMIEHTEECVELDCKNIKMIKQLNKGMQICEYIDYDNTDEFIFSKSNLELKQNSVHCTLHISILFTCTKEHR